VGEEEEEEEKEEKDEGANSSTGIHTYSYYIFEVYSGGRRS